MNKFLDIKFPDVISVGSSGGPEFATAVFSMKNKNENRNANWQMPRFRYNIVGSIKNLDDYNLIKKFFIICKGKELSFRFKDHADYKIENQFLFNTNDIASSTQIYKSYSFDTLSYKRKITKIVPNAFQLFYNSQIVNKSNYLIDCNLGIITFITPPPLDVNVYISCEFDVNVRFDIDYFPVIFKNHHSVTSPDIFLIEVF